MKLDEIVTWYQKKIGTCDKQQWEKTVEQKILDGFNSVTLKTAKLKTELIDVDLVRGSTFPKAKPKQSLLTVIRLAFLRYLFLPIYAQWWVKQTSPNIFAILLFLYITQMINWAVYTFNIHRLEHIGDDSNRTMANSTIPIQDSKVGNKQVEEHIVSLSELLIPMSLSFLLSLIHSQIVATNTASGGKTKRRRFSNTSQNGKRGEPRVRRRRKFVRIRNQDFLDTSLSQRKPQVFKNTVTNVPPLESIIEASAIHTTSSAATNPNSAIRDKNCETFHTASAIIKNAYQIAAPPAKHKFDLNNQGVCMSQSTAFGCRITDCLNDNQSSLVHKKRNVNWHSPIHNYAAETQEKQQQTSPQSISSTTSENNSSNITKAVGVRDASVDGNSTTSSPSPIKIVHIDQCVQEFYDDLINSTDLMMVTTTTTTTDSISPNPCSFSFAARRTICEDDGFESLNGKSSSGEDTNSPLPTTSSAIAVKNQLRLRLNAVDYQTGRVEELNAILPAVCRRKMPLSSESDNGGFNRPIASSCDAYQQTKKTKSRSASSGETDQDDDEVEIISSPASIGNNSNYNECTTSATEWLGVTTNSEECSYSSELDNSDDFKNHNLSDEDYDMEFTPAIILNSHGTTDRISCTVWDQREIKKAQMSVLEISSCIIERVESMPETKDYIYIGICFSFLLSLIPSFCRLCEVTIDSDKPNEINYFDVPMLLWEKASFSFSTIFHFAFGSTQWERTILIIGFIQRLSLTSILFIIFAVAERTFKQRFLYGKLFSHVTSSRRAMKSNLPHFRLNKVRNIKTWLSVRSYLKKRGPQRSVDVIVSAAFIVTLLLLAFLSVEWLKDSVHLHSHLNLEALMWSTAIGIFLLRFMTLGNKIHHKYRSVSVLITEQINLYLQIEQKPKKKEELMVSNSVLKLAADLLKELESPFKISGLSANPYLFTTIKVVILSALSGVLSEMLGFKLKLHKIKIK